MAADFAVGSDEPMAEWAQPRIDKSAATRKSGSARTRIGIPSAGYGWRAEDFVIPASRNTLALGWRVKAWGSPSLKEKFCRLVLDAEKGEEEKNNEFRCYFERQLQAVNNFFLHDERGRLKFNRMFLRIVHQLNQENQDHNASKSNWALINFNGRFIYNSIYYDANKTMATCQRLVNKMLQTDRTKVQGQTYVIKHGELRLRSEALRFALIQRPVPVT